MVSTSLLRLSESEHVLVLVIHHIVADAWSIEMILDELQVCYSAAYENQPAGLPELPIQYCDFACWKDRCCVGPAPPQQLGYWKERGSSTFLRSEPDDRSPASGAKDLSRRQPRARVRRDARRGDRQAGAAHGSDSVHGAARDPGFAAATVRRPAGRVRGTAMANRRQARVESLIGFFVNTVVLRIDVADELTVEGLIAQVRSVCLDGYEHQEAPFDRVVETVGTARDPAGRRCFS